jgi:hypothetical protein
MSTSKKKPVPTKNLDLYARLVKTKPDVQQKGATVPYTSVNGNMFSYLHASGKVALRLPAVEREKFLEKHKTKLFEAYGIIQQEYVTVPDALLADTDDLRPYFEMSYEYAKGLKPKPSKKAI